MHHHAPVSAVEVEWTFVSVKHPCTICGGHDGCRSGFEDEFACCKRVSSEWPLSAGGWVHRLTRFSLVPPPGVGDPGAGARQNGTRAMSLAQ
jgi:hypothetical protein